MSKDELHKLLETRDILMDTANNLTAVVAVLEMLRDTGEARPQDEQLEHLLSMLVNGLYRDIATLSEVNEAVWETGQRIQKAENKLILQQTGDSLPEQEVVTH